MNRPLSDVKLELHTTEDGKANVFLTDGEGKMIPGQRHVSVVAHYNAPAEITVTFLVDGRFVKIIPTRGKDNA